MKLRHEIPLAIVFIFVVCEMVAYIITTVHQGEKAWIAYLICTAIAFVGAVMYCIEKYRDRKVGHIPQNNNEG